MYVDIAGVQAMSGDWAGLIGELSGSRPPTTGFSCQASAAAVSAAHADIAAFTASLVAHVQARGMEVAEADSRYVANEADSVKRLAAMVVPVIGA